MPSWVFWSAVVLIVGTAVILFGALRDRHRRLDHHEQMSRPPARAVPGPGGEAVPRYVTDEVAGASPAGAVSTTLSGRERHDLERRLASASRIDHGMAAAGFVTDPPSGRAVLDEPLVLLCAEPVTTLRTLLPFLERPAAAHVVVAPDLDPALLRTLEVNQIQRSRPLLAVTGVDARGRDEVRIATGATPVPTSDLQSGWLPTTALGRCRSWVSDRRQSWVLHAEDLEGASRSEPDH